MEPSAATQELVAAIKQGRFDTVLHDRRPTGLDGLSHGAEMRQALVSPLRAIRPAPALPVAVKPALFIEPFGMTGVNDDRAHLVEGFRVELIACLTRFREWYVSGASVSAESLVAVSTRYVVITNAYQTDAVISVVMVLQEWPSNLAIWGERFELSLASWFEVQHRIVRRIAATLNVQLSTERLVRLSHGPDTPPEAFDIWLRGQYVIRNFSSGEWNQAAEMYARGIDRSPGFSPLYSGLSQMNNGVHFVQPGLFRNAETVARTLALAQRAVALDPRDSRAELCLGWAFAFSQRYAAAELHMELACQLNSNDPWTLESAAMFYAFCGNAARAQELSSQAMELSLSPTAMHWVYEASIRFLRGDYDGTIVAADRAHGALLTLPVWRAAALSRLGRPDEARREVEMFYAGVNANWINPDAPPRSVVCQWFLQIYPISRPDVWARLRDSMAELGMPVQGLVHTGAPLAA